MNCKKCGTEIPDNAELCANCGEKELENTAPAQPQNSSPSPMQPQNVPPVQFAVPPIEPPKKKKKTGRVILGLILIFLVGFGVSFGISQMGDEPTTESTTFPFQNITVPDVEVEMINPEYTDLLAKYNVTDNSKPFKNYDKSMAFANEINNEELAITMFAYEDDIIKEMISYHYMPVSSFPDFTEEELLTAAQSLWEQEYGDIEFATIEIEIADDNVVGKVHFKNLDNTENLKVLHEKNVLIITDSSKVLSAEKTKELHIDSGKYIPRMIPVTTESLTSN
ncbi:MAG: zinc ribbon domain-containing protein [Ruminococcaceae bacterium]|nr:zinc ribbon domain-containing protein [Oscillospiraceae bacterium]